MLPTDDCYELIKSLQPAEKRYFKLFASQHGAKDAKQYIKLFDAIDAMPPNTGYDELKLKRRLKDAVIIRNLPTMKNYLIQLVMKALRNFYSENSIESKLYELLQNEKILKEKRLNDLRKKTLKKAKEMAYEYEKFNLLLEIIYREYDLNREMNQKDLKRLHIDAVKEERNLLDLLENEFDYREMGDFLFIQQRTESYIRDPKFLESLERLAHSELLTGNKQPTTFRSKLHYYRSLSLLAKFRKDEERSWEYSKMVLQLYRENRHMLDSNLTNYKMALNNYLGSCHRLQKYNEFENILNEMKSLPSLSFDDEGEVFQNSEFYKLLYFLNTKQIDRAKEMIVEIENGLNLYKKKINDARVIAFYYNFAITFFMAEDFNKASNYCAQIIAFKTPVRNDIRYTIRLLDMICHFELGNTLYLSSLIRNNKRYLQKDERYFQFEKKICESLIKLTKSTDKSQEIEHLLKLKDKILELKMSSENNILTDELLIWIESRKSNRSINELINLQSGK